MKTSEEKWTAWIDGELTGNDLANFEASLPDLAAAEGERRQATKLGSLLKEKLEAPVMGNEDFFNHQLLTRIQNEVDEETEVESPASEEMSVGWWSIRRLLWVGASSLAIFAVCTVFVLRENPVQDQSPYLSQILNARVDPGTSPHATVSMFQSPGEKVTVLWVDGLQSLPSEFASK